MLDFAYVRKQLTAAQAARTPSARADALGRLEDGLDHLEYQARQLAREDGGEFTAEDEADRAAMEAEIVASEPCALRLA